MAILAIDFGSEGNHAVKGSGRRTTNEYRKLDVRELHKAGMLDSATPQLWCWYRGGEVRASVLVKPAIGCIELRYTVNRSGERREYAYPVKLAWTGCHYGGARPWFQCPDCGRRVAILYGGGRFVCRHCRRLAYEVQRETDADRAFRRVDVLRLRLGWPPGVLNRAGGKPKGMHWRTYHRLFLEYLNLADVALEGLSRDLGLVNGRLDRLADRLCNAQ